MLKLQESLFFGGWQLAVGSLPMSQWMTRYHVHMGRTNGTHRVNFLKKEKKFGGRCIKRWFCYLTVGQEKGTNKIKVHYKHARNFQRIDTNTIFGNRYYILEGAPLTTVVQDS